MILKKLILEEFQPKLKKINNNCKFFSSKDECKKHEISINEVKKQNE